MLEPLWRSGHREEGEADAARVLAECWLTATLFTAAVKPTAVQVAHTYDAFAARLVPALLRPARAEALVPLMIVDHARRLEVARGADARASALEFSVATSWLDSHGRDHTDDNPNESDEVLP